MKSNQKVLPTQNKIAKKFNPSHSQKCIQFNQQIGRKFPGKPTMKR